MDRAVDDAQLHLGNHNLDQCDVIARRLDAMIVDQPRRAQHQQARLFDFAAGPRDRLLDAVIFVQIAAKGLPL